MHGSVCLDVETDKLQKLIPKAVKRFDEEIGREKDAAEQAYFVQDKNTNIEVLEISQDQIGLSLDTPFGHVSFWFTPDREFLKDVSELAVERVNQAITILDNGKLRA